MLKIVFFLAKVDKNGKNNALGEIYPSALVYNNY